MADLDQIQICKEAECHQICREEECLLTCREEECHLICSKEEARDLEDQVALVVPLKIVHQMLLKVSHQTKANQALEIYSVETTH